MIVSKSVILCQPLSKLNRKLFDRNMYIIVLIATFFANIVIYAFANTRKGVIIIVPLIRGDNYMKSVLEELFYGNLCPNTDCRSKEKEVK